MSTYRSVGIVLLGMNIAATSNATATAWWSVVAEFLSFMPAMKRSGVHGYYSLG